ncbi:MAG: cytochrome c [Pseudomonas sp.]|nr:cytochrome c [Pseudomonas sp.]
MPIRLFLLLIGWLLAGQALAASLTVALGTQSRTWQSAELLRHPQARTLHIPDDVAYKRGMTYRVVPVAALLPGLTAQDHVQAVALDGFAAELPAAPLLATGKTRAWLAVEDPAHPWPPLAPGKPSAGPFYLIWSEPAAGHIGPEQWPFQIASLRQLASVAERFPAMRPDPALAADDPVNRGFALFQKNCLACHRLNGQGDAQFGPDLNIPFSPTEYFSQGFLQRYIRDPQAMRRWPQAKMPGFSAQVLPDEELSLLVGYLQHMAGRKAGQ